MSLEGTLLIGLAATTVATRGLEGASAVVAGGVGGVVVGGVGGVGTSKVCSGVNRAARG